MCVFRPSLCRLCSALFVFYRLPYLWHDFLQALHLFVCLRFLPPCLLLPHFLCLRLTAGVFLKNNKVWGRACACVFCAGLTDWMGWLHWAGFLCGPPANFMIYSAKGRGARPPVTTERELHVGLMISPQKCLLWLGLRGAQPAPPLLGCLNGGGGGGDAFEKKSSADWTESMQTLTITHVCGEGYEEGEERKWHLIVMYKIFDTHPLFHCVCVCYYALMLPLFFFLHHNPHPSTPKPDIVASGSFMGIAEKWTPRMM